MKTGDTLRITRQGTRCKHITEGVVQNITKHLVILSAGNYTECFNLAHMKGFLNGISKVDKNSYRYI